MTPGPRAVAQITVLVVVIGGLVLLFPKAFAFTEMAAREIRYFWWLILLLLLAGWLIVWGFKKK